MKLIHVAAASLSLMLVPFCSWADEVEDSIKEGQDFYKEGNLNAALNSFNYTAQLIRQKVSEKMAEFLPEAPDGWDKSEAESDSGASMFGGGLSSSCSYTNGDASIKVTVASNSPLLQSIMMVINNPMFMGNKKSERIGGQQALIEYSASDKGGSINIVVAGSALVTIEGQECKLEDMKAFASKIKFQDMVKFLTQ